MRLSWQDINLALREESVSLFYFLPAALFGLFGIKDEKNSMGICPREAYLKDGIGLYCPTKCLQYATFVSKIVSFVHHLKNLEVFSTGFDGRNF